MKKVFETPTIEITYYEEEINLQDLEPSTNPPIGDFEDENVDVGGWV